MIFFVLYAVLVWYFALKWRRRLAAFAAVAAGLGGLALVWWFHSMLNQWTDGRINVVVLRIFVGPYIGLVGLIGVYLSCLPRRAAPMRCPRCDYDFAGLSASHFVCPECGWRPKARRCPNAGCGEEDLEPSAPACPTCGFGGLLPGMPLSPALDHRVSR